MRSLLEHKIVFVLAVVYTGVLTWGSLISIQLHVPDDMSLPVNLDKMLHTLAHFFLIILWLVYARIYFRPHTHLSSRSMLVVLGMTFFYGIVIEFVQGALTEDRMRDPFDVIANSTGALLGMFVFATFINKSNWLKSFF